MIDDEMRKARFGVVEWHHPAVLELLESTNPLRPICELLESWSNSWETDFIQGPATEIFGRLDAFTGGTLVRHKVSTGPNHFAHQIRIDAQTLLGGFLKSSPKPKEGRPKKNSPLDGKFSLPSGVSTQLASVSKQLHTAKETAPEIHEKERKREAPVAKGAPC